MNNLVNAPTNNLRELACTVCGEQEPGTDRWFLISEDHWQDKLRILHWDDYLAAQLGMHCACSPAHLQQLVIHWMTTGSLDHPFARAHSGEMARRQRRVGWTARNESAIPGPKPIGELSVHRESMQRVLRENPQSLQTILDALLSALQKDTPSPEPKIDWDNEAARSALRGI
jgi:hypothetical protein